MTNLRKNELKKALKVAFPASFPVLAGFLVLGCAYGVLMCTKGYSVIWSTLFSAIAFCGSMQFAAITFLTVTYDPVQAFLLSIMVNSRHLFYGISMMKKYKGTGKFQAFLIYTLCDETFSLVAGLEPPDGISSKHYYFLISLLNYIYWVMGTFIGGMIGNFITFNTNGLDFALTALFVVLFLEQMIKKENRIPGIMGIICTLSALIILKIVFKSDQFVIPAMVILFITLVAGRKKICS